MPAFLDEQLNQYLNQLDRPATRKTYRVALRHFAHFLVEHQRHRPSLDRLNDKVLAQFSESLRKEQRSPRTIRTYLAAAQAFLAYALAWDWTPPAFSLEKAKAKLRAGGSARAGYPLKEIDAQLGALVHYYETLPLPEGAGEKDRLARLRILRNRALLQVFWSTGARLEEVRQLDRGDVGGGRRNEVIITGKGNKDRTIFLSPEALARVREYLESRTDTLPALFVSHHRPDQEGRVSASTVERVVEKAARALGITASPHHFRHHLARLLLDRGQPLEGIQELLGHSDIGTTRRVYAHYSHPSTRRLAQEAATALQEELEAAS